MDEDRVAPVSVDTWAEAANLRTVGEDGSLRGNSGDRGDLIRFPRDIGPLGGQSLVGARKYVLFRLGDIMSNDDGVVGGRLGVHGVQLG